MTRPGQFILHYGIPNVGHVVMHQTCLKQVAEEIPEDLDKSLEEEYNSIRNQYLEGTICVGS